MNHQIFEIAKKYTYTDITEQLSQPTESIECSIGFLGEFSTGKSTLINALMGAKVLPAMIKPTSKSLITIHPRSNVAEKQYFKRENDSLSPISPSEFSEIALGEKGGSAALYVPESDALKEGFILIDTPGFSSVDKLDADIAFGVLPQLDGIVICVDINKGSLPKTVVDFIKKPSAIALLERIMIVVTHRSSKSETTWSSIKEEIENQLASAIAATGKKNLQPPILLVDSEDALRNQSAAGLPELVATFQSLYYDRKKELQGAREAATCRSLTERLKINLEERVKMLSFSTPELDNEEAKTEKEIQQCNEDIKRLHAKLEDLKQKIESQVSNTIQSFKPQLHAAKAADISTIYVQMIAQLDSQVSGLVAKQMEGFTMPALSHWGGSLQSEMAAIERNIGLGKSVGTALFSAAVIAATYGAATPLAAEVGGGLAVQGGRGLLLSAAQNAAKSAAAIAAEKIANEALNSGGKADVESDGKGDAKSEVKPKTVLQQIATSIEAMNPVSWVADFAEGSLKSSAVDNICSTWPGCIANDIISSLENEYEERLIIPAKDRQRDHRENLSTIRDKKLNALDSCNEMQAGIQKDIRALASLEVGNE